MFIIADASAWADPITLLVAAVAGETAAIIFLIAWIRTLYEQRRVDQEDELKYRDGMLERVLVALGKFADTVDAITARGAK